MTISELQAKIAEILAAIEQLQTQIKESVITGCTIASFERNLKQGDTGNDVNCLQIILNRNSDTLVAESGAGSPGNETVYFGPLTKAAVIKFQEKYASDILSPWGIVKGTGIIGKTSLVKLNALLGK